MSSVSDRCTEYPTTLCVLTTLRIPRLPKPVASPPGPRSATWLSRHARNHNNAVASIEAAAGTPRLLRRRNIALLQRALHSGRRFKQTKINSSGDKAYEGPPPSPTGSRWFGLVNRTSSAASTHQLVGSRSYTPTSLPQSTSPVHPVQMRVTFHGPQI